MSLLAIPWLWDFSVAAKLWGAAPEQGESPESSEAKGKEGNWCGCDGTLPTGSAHAALLVLGTSLSLANRHLRVPKLSSTRGGEEATEINPQTPFAPAPRSRRHRLGASPAALPPRWDPARPLPCPAGGVLGAAGLPSSPWHFQQSLSRSSDRGFIYPRALKVESLVLALPIFSP